MLASVGSVASWSRRVRVLEDPGRHNPSAVEITRGLVAVLGAVWRTVAAGYRAAQRKPTSKYAFSGLTPALAAVRKLRCSRVGDSAHIGVMSSSTEPPRTEPRPVGAAGPCG